MSLDRTRKQLVTSDSASRLVHLTLPGVKWHEILMAVFELTLQICCQYDL